MREVGRLSVPTVRYVEVEPPEPGRLRVLYLTANPEPSDHSVTAPDGAVTTTSSYLRLDAEVREIQRTLRAAKYRDLVTVEHRPAATTDDLIDAINDVRPHVVHFSGHGWADGVVLDSGDLNDPTSNPITFDLLAQVLAATDTPPRVLVLNACETLAGAELLLPVVPVVIAMADTIDDTAAIVFARRFYAAIASAQSIASALAQAQAAMRVAALDDADLPQSATRDDVDLEDLVLVVPRGAGPADRAAGLLRTQGLSETAVAILRFVQQIETDQSFSGVLSDHQVVDAVGGTVRAIRTELQRLLDGDYIRASGEERDFGGGWDLIRPRLTTHGVAVLAS